MLAKTAIDGATENVNANLSGMTDRARAKDMKSVQSLFAKATRDDQRGNELARKLGMKVCAKG